jgi:hypothetical protein
VPKTTNISHVQTIHFENLFLVYKDKFITRGFYILLILRVGEDVTFGDVLEGIIDEPHDEVHVQEGEFGNVVGNPILALRVRQVRVGDDSGGHLVNTDGGALTLEPSCGNKAANHRVENFAWQEGYRGDHHTSDEVTSNLVHNHPFETIRYGSIEHGKTVANATIAFVAEHLLSLENNQLTGRKIEF